LAEDMVQTDVNAFKKKTQDDYTHKLPSQFSKSVLKPKAFCRN